MAASFDQAPYDYERMRPGYPENLIEDMIELTGLPEKAKILEIGCGTGQATAPMVRRGYQMTCLDIGENLLEIARNKFRGSDIRFINSSFENWIPDGKYDMVMSATAWHWIDKEIGYRKANEVLSKSGSLALIWNKHPTPFTGFFKDSQVVYDKVFPKKGVPKLTSIWVEEQASEITESGYFTDISVKEYPWSIRFSTEEYITLLNTFSDHQALPVNKCNMLYEGIRDIIESDYDGFVDRPYMSVLFVADKK